MRMPDMTMTPDMTPIMIPVPNGCNTATAPSGTVAYTTLSTGGRCMGGTCHNSGQPPAFMDMTTFMASMVNQGSSSAFKFVVPNQPNSSYLLYKLRGLQQMVPGGGGLQMPDGGTPLNDTDFCTMYDWILHGAPTT
jgi:hypothetical protein